MEGRSMISRIISGLVLLLQGLDFPSPMEDSTDAVGIRSFLEIVSGDVPRSRQPPLQQYRSVTRAGSGEEEAAHLGLRTRMSAVSSHAYGIVALSTCARQNEEEFTIASKTSRGPSKRVPESQAGS